MISIEFKAGFDLNSEGGWRIDEKLFEFEFGTRA